MPIIGNTSAVQIGDGTGKERQNRSNTPRLRDLSFGFASADFEASHDPDLLLSGFVDPHNLVEEARLGRRWLFLGYKGSGKSALGEHIRLVSEDDPHLFAQAVNIADVSFSTFSQILRNEIEPEARYPTVWSWLLLLFLFNSFSKDQGSNCARDEELYLAIETLKELGLLPEPKLNEAVSRTSDKSFSLKLTTVVGGLEATFKKGAPSTDLPFFVERLRLVSRRFKTENKHLLIIDGFDDLLRRGALQYDALGALIYEANRLNMDFANACVPVKILVLCRTDLFERLPNPNKNKIRQNAAVHIDWNCDLHNPKSSNLVVLINHRASLSHKDIDVFESFLPSHLGTHGGDIRAQLLEYTRYVPRDMVMLFKNLQEHSGDGPMTQHQVGNALTAYSRDYLLPEIKDELDGYIDIEDITTIFQLLGAARRISPSRADLDRHARMLKVRSQFDLDKVLSVMYECSAIGNLPNRRSNYSTFKHRNRHTSFNQDEPIMVHQGLWGALNLKW
jgi:hypothetical protein